MKKTYLLGLLGLGVAASSYGQYKTTELSRLTMEEVQNVPTTKNGVKSLKAGQAAFWSEDFANGFAGNNESNGAWTQTTDDVALWEYRGPATTPDNTVASRGSCGAGSVAIASTTASNGFVIFDSNFWDDPGTVCGGNQGSGDDASPHLVTLTSPSIDMSAQDAVQLFFETNSRNFNSELNIKVSVNGGAFTLATEIYDQLAIPGNGSTDNGQLVSVNLTDLCANQADVRVQFEFSGEYYYVMIDDIYFDTPPTYDLEITEIYLDDVVNNDIFTHELLPMSQAHLMNPVVEFTNKGLATQDVEVYVTVTDPSANVSEFSTTVTGIAYDSTLSVVVPTLTPDQYGVYTFDYEVVGLGGADEIPGDNVDDDAFSVNDSSWADQFGFNYVGSYYNAFEEGGTAGAGYAAVSPGQCFYTFNAAQANGIVTVFPNFTQTSVKMTAGQYFVAEIFKVNDKVAFNSEVTEDILDLVASVDYFLTDEDFTTTGDIRDVFIQFDDDVNLEADEFYLITITNSSGEPFNVGVTTPNDNLDVSGVIKGNIQAGVSLTTYNRFSNLNPYLKMSMINEPVGINEKEATSFELLENNPNPAKGYTTIKFSALNAGVATVSIKDVTGKTVYNVDQTVQDGLNRVEINTTSMKDGVYFYSVSLNGQVSTKKMVVLN